LIEEDALNFFEPHSLGGTMKHFRTDQVKIFILGMLTAFAFLLLLGTREAPPPNYGRYQVSAWGNGEAHGAFIVDSASGETKIVYRYKQQDNGEGLERNNLNKTFHSIK